MNDPGKKRELLNDILKEKSFETFNSNAKAQAMRVFARRHRMARARSMLAIAALALVSVTFASLWLHRGPIKPASPFVQEVRQPTNPERWLLSDEELLSYLPPNSCSLASADGKAILVFWDEEVRRRLFHEPELKPRP